jgi:hypothetical protein
MLVSDAEKNADSSSKASSVSNSTPIERSFKLGPDQ